MQRIIFLLMIVLLILVNKLWAVTDIGPRKDLFRIDQIEVLGFKKVEKEAILEKISLQKGMNLDNHLLKKDLNTIYSLKYFESVEAHHEKKNGKNILIFKVIERPIISKIIFEGNSKISEKELKEKIKTKEFSILDINTVKSDVKEMLKYYEEKGFYLANIVHTLKKVDKENIELLFSIKELDKIKIKKIAFLGNRAFGDEQLKGIMETREEGLFSFMSGSGNFKEFNFQTDIERIKYFYKTKGYLQINIGVPEITVSANKKWVFITIRVHEGPQFTVRNISFQGEILFSEDKIRETIQLRSGEIYSEELLRTDIQRLAELYQNQGYAFANVLRILHIVPGENKVDMEFSFEKGKIVYFGRITVVGNTKTRDKVIRRELKIREGAKYSGTNLRESRENINRLGFFEVGSVIFNTITPEGKDDILNVEINVKERNTGQISLGAGYSTAMGSSLHASISQNNFRGLGQNLSFSLAISDYDQTFNLGLSEPYFNDTKWTVGGDIFKTKNTSLSSFTYERKGFNLRAGHPIFEYTRLFVTYKLEETFLKGISDPTVERELENGVASSIRLALIRDKRNNSFEPSAGHYLSFATEYTGVGGDKKWWRNEADGRYYRRLKDFVFRHRLYVGGLSRINNMGIPRTERFYLGGARNLRGYDYEAIGPLSIFDDQGRKQEFNAGSLFSLFTQIEVEHPLAQEAGLKWVLFTDIGDANTLNNFKVYADYGFGLRWFSPIGVMRFEYGIPLVKERSSGGQFHFDLGQLF